MLKCISRFLPTRSVPALICFVISVGCSSSNFDCRPDINSQTLVHHDGKLYLVEFDKNEQKVVYVYIPPAVPGQGPGHWVPAPGPPPEDTPLKGPAPVDDYHFTPRYPDMTGIRELGVGEKDRAATSAATAGPATVVYILDEYGVLFKFDPGANAYVATLDFNKSIAGGAATSLRLAVTPDQNFAFITANSALPAAAQGSATVLIVDLKSFSIVSTIALPVSTPAGGTKYVPWSPAVAITPDGKLAYVVTQPFSGTGPSQVFVIDVAPRKITTTIPVPADSHLGQIAIAPDGTKAYLVDSLDTSAFTIQVLDLQSNTIDTPISIFPAHLQDIIGPSYIALHPDGTRLYFLPLTGGPVHIVSTITKAVIGTIPIATTGTRPVFGSQPIFTPDGLYLAFMSGPELMVWVDTLTDTVESTITRPPPPFGAIRNTGFFWVPNL